MSSTFSGEVEPRKNLKSIVVNNVNRAVHMTTLVDIPKGMREFKHSKEAPPLEDMQVVDGCREKKNQSSPGETDHL